MAHSIKQRGFTIVETLIAVSVFSMITMITMVVVIQLGRTYQQGATKAKLNDASRQIHALFTQSVEYGTQITSATVNASGKTYNVWCAGTTRFAWTESTTGSSSVISTYSDLGGGSLYTDTIVSCTQAFNPATAQHMLPLNAFVTKFDINNTSGIWTLDTRFGMGQVDMYEDDDIGGNCRVRVLGADFCAVVQYSSSALSKVGS
jgi:prepilin-type N-terminal cleavage/methylation domain-containing protein